MSGHTISRDCWCIPDEVGGFLVHRYAEAPPAVLLRDTPEDRERLIAALPLAFPGAVFQRDDLSLGADAILAALRDQP